VIGPKASILDDLPAYHLAIDRVLR